MREERKFPSWVAIPPWLVVGALLILVPILGFLTLDTINRQRTNTIKLMEEKGEALVRSLEAGARTGMMGMWGGAYQVQRLITETARLPDIVHIIVVDEKGIVTAHSDPSMIGKRYGGDLDAARITKSAVIEWREVPGGAEGTIFEVFRRFAPSASGYGRMMGRDPQQGWQSSWMERNGNLPSAIFVGLDMGPLLEGEKEDRAHTVVMGAGLLLLGLAGMVSVFLAQAYKGARSSLARVETLSNAIVSNMPIGLVAVDKNSRIALINDTAAAILAINQRDVIGTSLKESLPRVFFESLSALAHEKTFEKEELCELKDGRSIPLDVIAAVLAGSDDESQGLLFLFKDMSEMHRLKDEVERNKRLASIGMLAAGVAHEIRNPLSSIKGFATYFKERYGDSAEDKEISEVMIEEVERLNRVVGQLLEFARPMEIRRTVAGISALINHTVRLVEQDAAQRGVEIRTRLPAEEIFLELDEDKMKQVLINILINALDATDKGDVITVEVARSKPGESLSLMISDTGRGIKKDDLHHIFDPYFTTKQSGTGLGLALVHKIVKAHGGDVVISSTPELGTEVKIIIPANMGDL